MEKLGIHIVELLNKHPEVYLPGVGLFKKERIPAAFDEQTNSFSAPGFTIVLLSHEKGSANLLIESISLDEEISSEESEDQLKKVVGSILLELNEKGKAAIIGLGKLVKQQDKLIFTQINSETSAIPFYKSIKEFKLLSPSIKPTPPEELEVEHPIVLEIADDHGLEHPEEEAIELHTQRQATNWLWPVIVLICILGAGTFWYLNSDQQEQSLIAKELPKETVVLDSLMTDILTVDSTPVDSATTPLVEEPLASKTADAQAKTTFDVIVVSFGKQADAEEYVELMKKRGHQFHIVENRRAGNQIKVSYGSYPSEAQAQDTLNTVRESFAKEAWIFKRTPIK